MHGAPFPPAGPHGFGHGPRGPRDFGPWGEFSGPEEFNPDEFIAPRHSMRHPLSPEARKQARAIAEEMRAKFEQINGALFVKRHQLRALENAANPDVKAVGECATEIVQLRQERRVLRKELRERMFKEVFEPEAKKAPKKGNEGK
jgi:Spy/CpxP family protein refolding chaperone